MSTDCSTGLREALQRLSRRLSLGQSTASALAQTSGIFSDQDVFTLVSLVTVHERDGGDLAGMLESLADQIDSRSSALEAARGSASGALLSGRIVAGLPLLLLVLTPGIDRSLINGSGVILLAVGIGLVVTGMAWMSRLIPKLDVVDDPVAVVCDVAACALTAGTTLHSALGASLRACPGQIRPALERADRMVRIGASWPEALRRCGHPDLADVAASIAHSQRLGVPLARSLTRWAEARRLRRLRDFDVAVRRAPVLMVISLTVCMLPAYVVLGLAPVLRGY